MTSGSTVPSWTTLGLGDGVPPSGFVMVANRSENVCKVKTEVPNTEDLRLKRRMLELDVSVCFLLL